MQLSGFLLVIFISLLLFFEVSSRQNEEFYYQGIDERSPRFLSNNNGLTYNSSPDNSLPKQRERVPYQSQSRTNFFDDVLFYMHTPVYTVRSTGRDMKPSIEIYPDVFRQIQMNLFKELDHALMFKIKKTHVSNLRRNRIRRPNSNRFRPSSRRRTDKGTRRQNPAGINNHFVPRNRSMLQFTRNTYRKPSGNKLRPRQNVYRRRNVAGINNVRYGNNSYGVRRQKRSSTIPVPNTVYPEILVIVDYSLFKKFNRSVWELVTYLIGFWNGVDLRFRSLSQPKVRLSIAGILIAEDQKALSYISNHIYNTDTLLVARSVTNKQEWLYQQRANIPVTNYDIALTMTKFNLLDEESGKDAAGYASLGGACLVEDGKKVFGTGFINDVGNFEAIMATAHEIGHLLGIEHDSGSRPECGVQDGYIMGPVLTPKRTSWDWSWCSQLDFYNFFNKNKTCLYNEPRKGTPISRLLPGKLLDAKEQCKMLGYNFPVVDNDMCLRLTCYTQDASKIRYYSSHSPADGTVCGTRKICLRGACIDEDSITL